VPDMARGRGSTASKPGWCPGEVSTASCSNLDLRLLTAGGGVVSITESMGA
jgi:hypothetical protein